MASHPLTVSEIYEIVVDGICDAQAVLNVFHVTIVPSGPLNPEVDTLEHLLGSFQANCWAPLLNDFQRITQDYQVQRYIGKAFSESVPNPTPPPPPAPPNLISLEAVEEIPGGERGFSINPWDTSFNAVGVQYRNGKPGREGRGGFRMPPCDRTIFDKNRLLVAAQDEANDAVSAWPGGFPCLTGGHYEFVIGIFNRTHALRNVGFIVNSLFCKPIQTIKVRELASSQISRKVRSLSGR